MSSALKAVDRLAIIEPNTVELTLNSSLDFQKRVLESTEHKATVQKVIQQLTGVTATITLKLIQATPPPATVAQPKPEETSQPSQPATTERSVSVNPTQQPKPPTVVVREDIDPKQDAFVQDVVDVFGATVERIINAPVKRDAVEQDQET